MENKSILCCLHQHRIYRMTFSCERTGDYSLELCEKCYADEPKDFLIREEKIEEI